MKVSDKKQLSREREWWEKNVDIKEQISNPYPSKWKLYDLNKKYNKIAENYNFNGKRVFVGGCGSGLFEKWVSEKFTPKRIVGMDLSAKMIKASKRRKKIFGFKANFIIGNIQKTKFKKHVFDVAIIIDALHHVPNAFKTLKEMSRIADDIILYEPNALNPVRRYNELAFKDSMVKEASFSKSEIRKWMKKIGYKQINIENTHFVPRFFPENILWMAKYIDVVAENIPLVKEISGSLFVIARKS